MTYLEEFEAQLRGLLAGKLPQNDEDEAVELAVTTCRESWKNGLQACKKRAENNNAPAGTRTQKKHYQGKK